jgi:hypothetical protein
VPHEVAAGAAIRKYTEQKWLSYVFIGCYVVGEYGDPHPGLERSESGEIDGRETKEECGGGCKTP